MVRVSSIGGGNSVVCRDGPMNTSCISKMMQSTHHGGNCFKLNCLAIASKIVFTLDPPLVTTPEIVLLHTLANTIGTRSSTSVVSTDGIVMYDSTSILPSSVGFN